MKKYLGFLTLIVSLYGSMASAADAAAVSPLTVITLSDGREILGDEAQLTAYVFDVDDGATSNCYEQCAVAWPPILAPANVELGPDLGTTERKDGTLQLTYKGRPIYLFVGDSQTGDINGDGLDGVWHLIEL